MKQKVMFVLSLLFGLMFISQGLNKFLNFMPVPENLPDNLVKVSTAMMQVGWLMPLVGIVEIIGGVLFIAPKTRALGAIVILPVMVGIVLINTVTDTMGLPFAGVLFAINIWVIFENRAKYLPMIQ